MKTKGWRIGLVILTCLGSPVIAAESAGGRLAMPANQENNTARVLSMGSAVVGLPQGSASLLWNPAGLGYLDRVELGAHHSNGLGDAIYEIGVMGMPMGVLGGVAMNLNYVNNGTFEGRDAFGVQTGSYTAGNFGLGFGWGKQVLANMAVGMALRWNYQNLADMSYNAVAADVGLLWTPVDPWTVGLTYTNFGTPVAGKFLDSGLRLGASYRVNPELVLAAASELKPIGGWDALRLGVEDWILPMLAIRVGYVQNFADFQLSGVTGVTAGLGLKLSTILLDYAIVPSGELGTAHHISFTYQGEKTETRMVKPKPVAMPPMIAGVEPDRGLEGGGTSVLIKGSGFSGVSAVVFGDMHAFSYIVHSDSRITAKSPAQTGTVDVVVVNGAGASPIVSADRFTYFTPPPAIDGLSPMLGPIFGGTTVAIAGTGLSGVTLVTFGDTSAASFVVNADHLITAKSPAHAVGVVDVVATGATGSSQMVRADRFTFFTPPPVITALTPTLGVTTGGTTVAIAGTGLIGVTLVTFGDTSAASFVVNADNLITAKSPAHAVGVVDVVAMSSAGSSSMVQADRFTYYEAPVPVIPVVIARVILLDDTFFDFDQSNTNAAAEELLKEHIRVLKDNPELAICISGYTSAQGTEEYNLGLSERRANSVRDFLVKGGIEADRLTVIGYGKQRPANFEPIPSQIRSAAAKSNMRVLFEIGVCPKP